MRCTLLLARKSSTNWSKSCETLHTIAVGCQNRAQIRTLGVHSRKICDRQVANGGEGIVWALQRGRPGAVVPLFTI